MKRTIMGWVAAALFMAMVGQVCAAEADWMTDFPKAQSKAKADKKMLLMDFTGSDWCPPCKELHKKVLTSDEFIKYAKDNLVLVMVDFPQTKELTQEQQKANEALKDKFSIEGFPTVIVLSSDGTELSKKVGYGGESAKEFVEKLKAIQEKEKTK